MLTAKEARKRSKLDAHCMMIIHAIDAAIKWRADHGYHAINIDHSWIGSNHIIGVNGINYQLSQQQWRIIETTLHDYGYKVYDHNGQKSIDWERANG